VITADDVETLVFDVLGTVVDEAGSMRADLAVALNQADAGQQVDAPDQAGAAQQAEALSAAWARRFGTLFPRSVQARRGGPPTTSTLRRSPTCSVTARSCRRLPSGSWDWPGTG
jgi:hypothetical protein